MFRRILISFLAIVSLASCSLRPRVIPADKLSDIYVQMYVSDQWLLKNSRARRTADTTLFYDGILSQYGYTYDDYDYTVAKYLENPEKFKAIFEDARAKMETRRQELADMIAIEEKNKAFDLKLKDLYKEQKFSFKKTDYTDFRLYVEGGNSIRTDKEPQVGDVVRFEPVAAKRQGL